MPKPIQVRWPVGGVSEDLGFSDQPGLTARDAKNVRGIDPVTGRLRGGVRSGTPPYVTGQVAAAKVAHIASITTAATNQTLASLGDALTQDWAKANTVASDSREIRCGTQGDAYTTDGNVGITKRNADGALMWKIALAATDKNHLVRALYVDSGTPNNAGTDLVLAGVSSGGSSLTAKFWAYQQLNDNKVQKLWELSPQGYVEEFAISNDKLFVLMNFPDRNRAYVVVYDDYLTNTPTETNRWPVPYPANSMTASPFDKFVFTASDANASRDDVPNGTKGSFSSEDYTIFDLPSYKKRVWANLDASKIETLSIQPRNLAYPGQVVATDPTAPPPDLYDGGNVLMWVDSSGQGRNMYQTAHKLPTVNAAGTAYVATTPASRGAIYRSTGAPNGGPCLHFDGRTCGMESEEPSSTDKANRGDNLSLLPSYKGAQFAVFMVVKASADNVRRALLCHGGDTSTDSQVSRWIGINSNVGIDFSSGFATTAESSGQVSVWEPGGVAGDAATSSNVPTAPSGFNAFPLGGGLPDSGFAVITWICDGGTHDVSGTATRSVLRVNGHPCDRWQSRPFSTLKPTQLGFMLRATVGSSSFVGDVCQILVMNDWYGAGDAQQSLVGSGDDLSMRYPDAAWSSAQDSNLERIEGWLAHKWGISHELPGGKAGWLTMTSNATAGQTVTVGTVTYTYRATPAATNDVAIGASIKESLASLARAINHTGTDIVDYYRTTVVNPDYRASMPVAVNATIHYAICARSRNANISGVGAFAETITGTWNSANASTSIAGGGVNTGWYPHPFYIDRTATTVGGPPRTAGAATVSKYWMLRSPYPILAAWDPASGKAKDVLTSNYNDTTPTGGSGGQGIGGIGYGVRIASTGAVFSCGPRQAAVSALSAWSVSAISADPVDVRKIGWSNQSFNLTGSASNDVWTYGSATTPASPGALTYAYPRMAVDKFDDLYVPVGMSTADSLIGFKLAGTGAASYNPVLLFKYSTMADSNEGYAVAVSPVYPDFTGFSSIQRAETLLLATAATGTTRTTNFKLRTISVTQAVGSPRTLTSIAVAGSQVSKFTTGAITPVTLTDSVSVSATRNSVFASPHTNKLYLTDGNQTFVYDPVTNAMAIHRGTSSGGVPKRCALIETWNGSLVLARQAENPNQYFISKQGDPANWDMNPYTITQAQAITGSDGSAGVPPDIVNAFIPYNDDLAFLGGDHTIFRITGRPSLGGTGEIHLVSDSIGIAFGRAWCKDPRGIVYFFSSRGSVYRIAPGGFPEPLSSGIEGIGYRSRIERRLQAINLSTYTVQMAWSDQDKGFHLIVCPYGAGGTVVEHYFWEEAKGGWWPDRWASSTIQPTCIAIHDGDAAADRVVLIGCEDGRIRKFDRNAIVDDTATPIDASVLIGPLAPKETATEVVFSRLQAVLANDQTGRPFINVYVTDRADFLGSPVWSGQLRQGRNPFANFKRRGAFVYIEITSSDANARWAYEQISLDYAVPAGIKRAVSA